MAIFHYYLPDRGESPEDARDFESNSIPEEAKQDHIVLCWVAEEAAEVHHDCHDGWEDDWPVEFAILDEEKVELGRVEVNREDRPRFCAV